MTSNVKVMTVFLVGVLGLHFTRTAESYDTWTPPELIGGGDYLGANYQQIACDPSGNVFAVWYQSDGPYMSIYANRNVPGTGWGSAQPIESSPGHAQYPEIACDPSGNAFAVWHQGVDTRSIYSNRYVPGSGWGTAQLIEHFPSSGYMPQIACDSQGNAMAVWYLSTYSIGANYYVRGVGWGTAQLIESGNTWALDPQVAFDSNGNAWAVWDQAGIRANRFVPGSGWATEELVGVGGWPQIACDNQGNAFVVWPSWGGMYASRTQVQPRLVVEIDIKPGSYPNTINLGSQGVIPVAVLSSADFNATTVDPTSVQLSGAGVAVRGQGKSLAHVEDVNGDGLFDLVCQVETENLDPGAFQGGEAILTGETFDGTPIEGRDEIVIVPSQ